MSAPTPPPRNVVVIIGVGGMGLAIARRLGSGQHLILADFSEKALEAASASLEGEGYDNDAQKVDVSDFVSVQTLATAAGAKGTITAIIHTAGLSPAQAPTKAILDVDLLGTAHVLEAFLTVLSPGTSVVCIASMAGHMAQLSPALETHLAVAPVASLLTHAEIDPAQHPGQAYILAKRANQIRVQAMSGAYGAKGARVNTVSPGFIQTAMGAAELEGEMAMQIKQMIAISAAKRVGTPGDIADAVDFLVGTKSSMITGNDILVDGGTVAASKWIQAQMAAAHASGQAA
ncbi:short-chain dehydrogenase/oxidoreductase [Hyaloscypha variabilis]|jgi:NAD(P)-dependent dehydrogenase (short-subunit alcohol dehydrogenase family)|uniref:Short-chain dehydrogenase/oxidoreductase n=1 Tax=Hyaloscypha variabilis (strain UAMH 11265 / GT02V1 / F) TaxID=1149755 RepID=A0A2J6RTJ7_HYAVF|nr:short-chain dehydrogenase/oxidoreductase [Hyaloscypha variabilis F]